MVRFDITGEKFGKLLALSFSHMKDSRQYWKYRCDCGNEKIMLHKSIKAGLTNSCGCMHHLPNHPDLTGEKFNKLSVLSFSHTEKGKTYWNCICDCGITKTAQGKDMKSGHTKSCGCLNHRPQYDDLTGKRFNMLEVIKYSHTVVKTPFFEVKCDCGNIKNVRSGDLKSGKTQSCGCKSGISKLIIGNTYQNLTILEHVTIGNGYNHSRCLCTCGKIKVIKDAGLLSGETKSCGCRGRGSQTIGTIYGIYDDCANLMYIGQTVRYQLDDRLNGHLKQPTNVNMQQWFESINYLPTIKPIMKNVPIDILNYAEKKAIFFYKNKFTLLNMTHN